MIAFTLPPLTLEVADGDIALEATDAVVNAANNAFWMGSGVAGALKVAPNTLTFHLDRLREAGLVTVRRDGRQMIYAARFDRMNALIGYLTENCCQGRAAQCTPAVCKPSELPAPRQKEHV